MASKIVSSRPQDKIIAGDPEIAQLALADLAKSGITDADAIKSLGLVALTAEQTLSRVKFNSRSYEIPYFGIDGRPMTYRTPEGKVRPFVRYKLLDEVRNGDGKTIKYGQAKGSGIHLYLPQLPGLDWKAVADDPAQRILVVEGAKKAICAFLRLNTPAISVDGVWSFRTPDLDLFKWKGREVVIVYDSDLV
jgi:hypothetical protein